MFDHITDVCINTGFVCSQLSEEVIGLILHGHSRSNVSYLSPWKLRQMIQRTQ